MKKVYFLVFALLFLTVNAFGMEDNIGRRGEDYSNFNLKKAKPEKCRKRCLEDPKCKAWTYVKPNTIQGPNPRCWLKHTVPQPIEDSCCVSGVKEGAAGGGFPAELDVDRLGSDYKDFDLDKPSPKKCWKECKKDPKCKAYTYVRPGIQGDKARCWFKDSVPSPKSDPCCISGVK